MAEIETDELLAPLRADPAEAAILCDIDGTLAPIVDDPEAAAVPAPVRALLSELASRYGFVACISGRRASAARRIVGLDQLTYAGNHGLELLAPGDVEPSFDAALGHRGSAASEFASRLDWNHLSSVGLRLEDKGPIQAIHWRTAAAPDVAEQRVHAVAELAEREGLHAHFGRMVLELRPVVTVDKGVATNRLVRGAKVRNALFGGDDRTDLDAFRALRELEEEGAIEHAVCVGVASIEGPDQIQSEADVAVDGPEGFAEFLRRLL